MNINNMNIKEKIGQMLCFAFHGINYNLQVDTLIRKLKIGNIIYFARNIKTIDQVKNLNSEMQNNSQIPLFIGLDQEGGMVRRITDSIIYLPGAMSLAAINNLDNIYKIYNYAAYDLKQLGFNVNYAPIADINNNPNNPVINSRSFGDNPYQVANCVKMAFSGMKRANILSVTKHFPGHGDTNVDSHLGLPIVNKTKDDLYNLELIPFIEAINTGIEGIMLSHILYKKN